MAPYCNFKIQLFRYKISSLGKRTVDTYWAQLLPSKTDGPSDKGSLGPTKTKESIQKTVYNLHLLQLDSRWGLTLNLKQFLIFILSIFTKLQTWKQTFSYEKVQTGIMVSEVQCQNKFISYKRNLSSLKYDLFHTVWFGRTHFVWAN